MEMFMLFVDTGGSSGCGLIYCITFRHKSFKFASNFLLTELNLSSLFGHLKSYWKFIEKNETLTVTSVDSEFSVCRKVSDN